MGNVYNDTLFNVAMQYGTSFGTFDLNGSTLKIAAVFRARGQQITKIGCLVSSVASPPVYLADLQSVVSAAPSTTVLGGGSPASATFTPVAGWQWITLTNPYTPTLGDIVAAVIEYSSGTIDASHHAVFNLRIGANGTDLPVPMSYNGTTWSNSNTQFPLIAVQYSDGTVHQYMCSLTGLPTNIDFNNSSTPNEYGITFVAPGNVAIDSLLVGVKPGSTWTGVVTVYDSNSASLVGSDNVTVTQNETFGGSGIALTQVPLTPIALTAGLRYYIGWKATTGNNIRAQKHTYESTAGKRAIFGDASFVSRKDSGAWTQDDASVCLMTPMISNVVGTLLVGPPRRTLIPTRTWLKCAPQLIMASSGTGATVVLPVRSVRQTTRVIVQKRSPLYLSSSVRNDILIPVKTRQVQTRRDVIRRAPSYIPAPIIVPILASRRTITRQTLPWGRPAVRMFQTTNAILVAPRRVRPYPVFVRARSQPNQALFSSIVQTNTILVTSPRKVR